MITPAQASALAAYLSRERDGSLIATLEAILTIAVERLKGSVVALADDLYYVAHDCTLVRLTTADGCPPTVAGRGRA